MTGGLKRTPFFKILIANRGEIALRIMATCRRLGYGVVAVYSDADRESLHVREADQAVRIGEALPAQSYLNIAAIIAAAKASGAGAVHPGYGFLAENEDFAQACRDAGLVFIGPSPESIKAMGNKAGAKEIMQKAGVPVVPGYQGADQSDAVMLAEARTIGFPVMIKAVAGGGGRGMRLVADESEFAGALRSARSEANAAFGDGTVILERAIPNPRHIEIQVFGDRYGNAIHLGERDCSVQRRHQKLIEEAPSPAVSPKLRQRMGEVAVAAVRSLRYEGAGTLEFLLDERGEFYFMEMNTRLQVEHPVTEAITGLDLVELQLRVAGGEPLGLVQEDIKFSGHAIEVRLCSEDAEADFMPQSGTMARWQMPEGVRVEHALQSGSEIPPFYDSMIAKLIGSGSNREEARSRLICGLEQTVAFGVTTNQSFLMACLRHPAFAQGRSDHRFHRQPPGRTRERRPSRRSPSGGRRLRGRACRLAAPCHSSACAEPTQWADAGRDLCGSASWSKSAGPCMIWSCCASGKAAIASTTADATIASRSRRSKRRRFASAMASSSSVPNIGATAIGSGSCTAGSRMRFAIARWPRPKPLPPGGGDGKVRAAMNGRVVAVLVKQGERVTAGQAVMTLEAMKMEHVHRAGIAGTVTAIDVAEGEQVAMGKVVVEIEAG